MLFNLCYNAEVQDVRVPLAYGNIFLRMCPVSYNLDF